MDTLFGNQMLGWDRVFRLAFQGDHHPNQARELRKMTNHQIFLGDFFKQTHFQIRLKFRVNFAQPEPRPAASEELQNLGEHDGGDLLPNSCVRMEVGGSVAAWKQRAGFQLLMGQLGVTTLGHRLMMVQIVKHQHEKIRG